MRMCEIRSLRQQTHTQPLAPISKARRQRSFVHNFVIFQAIIEIKVATTQGKPFLRSTNPHKFNSTSPRGSRRESQIFTRLSVPFFSGRSLNDFQFFCCQRKLSSRVMHRSVHFFLLFVSISVALFHFINFRCSTDH